MMSHDIYATIYRDLEEGISKQHLSRICQLYEHIAHNDYKETVALVVLLHEITECVSFAFPGTHERMCTQRGVNYQTAFSTRTQMVSYTSAEFAKERYNISDDVYQEILRFNDETYSSATKAEAMRILEKLK